MNIEKKNLKTIFLHRVLAVQNREISLPVGAKTAQGGNLGLVKS